MQNNLVMTSSPHLRDHSSTQRIMQEVCLALLPAGIAGVIIFGWSALMLICVSVATCVLSEFVWEKLTKQTVTIGDWSAVVTGLLLFIIRAYANYPEGCSFAILFMNVCTPLIDRFTAPHPFGEVKKHG